MISRLGAFCNRIAEQIVPDPFIFALILTLVTLLMGVALTPSTPGDMVKYWMNGFWDLLTFAMQMVLILVTGGVLAQSPPVRKVIDRLAAWPSSSAQATMMVGFFAMASALINWGLGLIVGALLARDTAKSLKARGIPHHYPLIVAAGYTGLMIWHGGLSGSAPLSVATPGHFLEKVTGIIPVTQTTFGGLNLFVTLAILFIAPFFLRAMLPKDKSSWVGLELKENDSPKLSFSDGPRTIAQRLDQSLTLTLVTCALTLGFLVYHFATKGLAGLDLNSINAVFLFLGFLFFLRPIKYVQAVAEAASGASGIILQFPFYAGIMGMMRDSGLVEVLSNAMVNISGPHTFTALGFLSAGFVNLFVPSGGGQWAVQGPILIGAAKHLGVSQPDTVMALAYGDEWTNMLQPFWALPLLGITGLEARKIIGYSAAVMLLVGPLIILGLLIF